MYLKVLHVKLLSHIALWPRESEPGYNKGTNGLPTSRHLQNKVYWLQRNLDIAHLQLSYVNINVILKILTIFPVAFYHIIIPIL